MGEVVNRCPACREFFTTPAEFAGHICSLGQGQEDVANQKVREARDASHRAALVRAAKQPDGPNLAADVRNLCQTVIDCWDGRVECIIVLVPTGAREPFSHGAYTTSRERTRQLLSAVLARIGDQVNLKKKINGEPQQ